MVNIHTPTSLSTDLQLLSYGGGYLIDEAPLPIE
jgi:hypothetical protein